MKKLNVKKTCLAELEKKWGFYPILNLAVIHYIRCNSKGEINWEKAPVYNHTELIERDNVTIIK